MGETTLGFCPEEQELTIDDQHFDFDKIIDDRGSQEDMYEAVGIEAVNSALEGFNFTIVAYGQVRFGNWW